MYIFVFKKNKIAKHGSISVGSGTCKAQTEHDFSV